MSILSGSEIKKRMEAGQIVIRPFDDNMVNPHSVNLRLGNKLLVYNDHMLDLREQNETSEERIPDYGILLKPGKLYLGKTHEWTETYGFVPRIDGRSSIGRLGCFVHITAGYGDHGFCGHFTLEISVIQPLRVYAYWPICQISYSTIEGELVAYKGKYQNSNDVVASRAFLDRGDARATPGD